MMKSIAFLLAALMLLAAGCSEPHDKPADSTTETSTTDQAPEPTPEPAPENTVSAWVYHPEGLITYNIANMTADSIGYIERGQKVELTAWPEPNHSFDLDELDGLRGRMAEAWGPNGKSFIFSGYLLPYPPPERYQNFYSHLPAPDTIDWSDETIQGNEESYHVHGTFQYANGIRVSMLERYEYGNDKITFPGLSMDQGVLAVRELVKCEYYGSLVGNAWLEVFGDSVPRHTWDRQQPVNDYMLRSIRVEAENGYPTYISLGEDEGCFQSIELKLNDEGQLTISTEGGC